MKLAQRLYEGIELGDQGAVGLITYMRTDSPRVSDDALGRRARLYRRRYGKDYLPDKPNFYRSGKSAQEAHEAIRPTALERDPESLAHYLDKDALALYTLIYNRFVSSQMKPAVYDRTTVDIDVRRRGLPRHRPGDEVRRLHAGLSRGPRRTAAEDEDDEATLPPMTEGEMLKLLGFIPEQHFTQPPPRFTQATLIKELEDKGIGRPSTYAAIMTSILNREYVEEDESKRMRPTSLGRVVTDLLVAGLPRYPRSRLHRADGSKSSTRSRRATRTGSRRSSASTARSRSGLGEAKKKMPAGQARGPPDRYQVRSSTAA